MRHLALFAAVLLSACVTAPDPGPGGHIPEDEPPVIKSYPQDREQCMAQPEVVWCQRACDIDPEYEWCPQ